MNKPIVFFSHSSADKEVLAKLKDLFVDKTGGTIDVFLSSDGQSIPLGRNWVYRIQKALDEAKLMVIFLTPNSIRSKWVYFEAGYAYSKGIRVVPVGFLGADVSSIPPPLSLLQGFNIVNKDGLDNLIALVNEVFSFSHKSTFTEEEYATLVATDNSFLSHPFGIIASLVDDVVIELTKDDNLACINIECMTIARKVLEAEDQKYHIVDEQHIIGFGWDIYTSSEPNSMEFVLDPTLIKATIPLAIKIIRKVREEGVKGIEVRIGFVESIYYIDEIRKVSARLYGTGIVLGETYPLAFGGMEFRISHYHDLRGTFLSVYLEVVLKEDRFDLHQLGTLLNLLFERGVLYKLENQNSY